MQFRVGSRGPDSLAETQYEVSLSLVHERPQRTQKSWTFRCRVPAASRARLSRSGQPDVSRNRNEFSSAAVIRRCIEIEQTRHARACFLFDAQRLAFFDQQILDSLDRFACGVVDFHTI